MNIKAFIIAFAILSCMMAVSCEKTPAEELPVNIALSVTASSDGMLEFKDGDVVGVYASEGNSISNERFLNNEKFTKQDSIFSSSRSIGCPEQSTLFSVYWPFTMDGVASGNDTRTVSVAEDQSSFENYVNSDFLLGTAVWEPGAEPVIPVMLNRAMAKVNISVNTGGSLDADISAASLSFRLNTSAVVSLSSGTVSSPSDEALTVPYGSLTLNEDGKYDGLSFITVPQDVTADKEFVNVTLGDESVALPLGKAVEFKSGMQYHIELLIDRLGVDYKLDFTISEEPWTDGIDVDDNVGIEGGDDLEYVTDIDNNQYPVVRIGKKLWMAENLVVTRFNDGTDIPLRLSSTEWYEAAFSETPGYSYFEMNDVNIEKYGLYYNWHAVESGKLCPKGWRMPTLADYEEMVETLGGVQAAHPAMKATSGWVDMNYQELPQYQGTNSSGFNGVPAGWRLDGGDFRNAREFAYFWTSTVFEDYHSYGVVLASENTEVLFTDFHRGIGMAVRCVKY